ncbi:hypothetical protein E2C01_045572 [Portunus trituberculatus]|uniref:Uncharacterized protein n=1 Tax=Portunus trituberculatus TaxID=210409 RepID=A0A5B7FVB0_PORTR|nr:hypothetical protein [Portunus trituberculatus]
MSAECNPPDLFGDGNATSKCRGGTSIPWPAPMVLVTRLSASTGPFTSHAQAHVLRDVKCSAMKDPMEWWNTLETQ